MSWGRRAAAGWLVVALALTGCAATVSGHGAPGFVAAGPKRFHVPFGELEVTPLAVFDVKTFLAGEDAVRIQIRVKNPGTTVVKVFAGGEAVADAGGRERRNDDGDDIDTPAGDPAQPAFPNLYSLAPGESIVGFMTFPTGSDFRPATFRFVSGAAEWPIAGIPHRRPRTETAPTPADVVPVGTQVLLTGIDLNATPSGFVPQRVIARVDRLIDPVAGDRVAPGYRLVAVQIAIGNLGTNRYNAVPSAAMTLFDDQGYGYEPVTVLGAGEFRSGLLSPGQQTAGRVGFLVPTAAKLSHVGLYLSQGDKNGAGRWKLG